MKNHTHSQRGGKGRGGRGRNGAQSLKQGILWYLVPFFQGDFKLKVWVEKMIQRSKPTSTSWSFDLPQENLLIYAHLVANFLLLCCLHYHLQTQSKLFRLMHHSISSCNNTYNLVQDHKNRVIHLKLIHQLSRNIESKLKNQPEAFILVWPSNQTLISQRSLVLKKLPMIGAVNYYYLLPLHCNLLHMNMFVVLNWLW